ncbi:HTH domain-containing protein [Campylobacter rectus]
MTALEVAKKVLEIKKQPLNPNRIYKIADELDLTKELNLSGKTPWDSFSAQIYSDLKENDNSIFEKISEKPILIKLKSQNLTFSDAASEVKQAKSAFDERDLHPLLANFVGLSPNFNARVKTIFHESSTKSKKRRDKWLYPDIVGVSFEHESYKDNVLNFAAKFVKIPLKIYSFEMKKYLSIANLREYYFQAVSNSSWANEGYLVALDIDESDEELMELIGSLNSSFGIGVLSLDSENLAQSKILAQPKFRANLDFNIINELCKKNPHFNKFLETVKDYDSKNKKRFDGEFDRILTDDEMQKYLKNKKIV